jgi:integrase/recombinase XerD
MSTTALFPLLAASMSTAQLAAVSYLARSSGHTHALYAFQLKEWFTWCTGHGLDPLVGAQRAHVELCIRQLGGRGLMDSLVVTMMHGVRGLFRFAHIDGLPSPATRPCTRGCRRCTGSEYPHLKGWVGLS